MRFSGLLSLVLGSFLVCQCTAQEPGPVEFIKKIIDSPLDDIQWATDDVIFVISENGHLYRSDTGGRSWENQQRRLMGGSSSKEIVSCDISEKNPKFIFFRGVGSANWFSTDMGKTYQYSEKNLIDVRLHATQPAWILGSIMSDGCSSKPSGGNTVQADSCFKTLVYSKNFGKDWIHALDYVVQFDWAPIIKEDGKDGKKESNENLIFVTAHAIQLGDQKFGFWDKNIHFMSSKDYFTSSQVLVSHGNRFLFGDYSYLFVAAVNPLEETEVSLMISRDNSTVMDFHPAVLPVDLTEHSYTILDTSEGAVFLHVNHRPFSDNADTGHVYISDWSGLSYSLSLPYNHRSSDGKCDFEKIEGLEGVYMANFIDVDDNGGDAEDTEAKKKSKKTKQKKPTLKAKTVITFDKGAEWSYLAAPTRDADGKEIKCSTTKDCHLHLHGITDLYGPFYSARTATGIIMATGTIGRYLRQGSKINTYLSRDAGLTWKEVAKGSHIYEFGDHGGLIVMANDETPTNSILYSWNEGVTWDTLKISDDPFQIENIIIEPTAVSQRFVVYGWMDDNGILVYVDFSELHTRDCIGHNDPDTKDSDYETWTPSDGRLGGKCLMGHVQQYVRRKADRACFNPEKFERPIGNDHCACTRADFECDYGYETEDLEGGPCVEMRTDPRHADPTAQKVCVGSSTYRVTKGYRRVPGDTCVGGAEWDAAEVACPSAWIGGSHAGKVVLIILALVALSSGVVTFINKYDLHDGCLERLKGRVGGLGYKIVGANGPTGVDEEAFYLNDDEFSQSAQLINDNDDDDRLGKPSKSEFSALPSRRRGDDNSVPVLAPPTDD